MLQMMESSLCFAKKKTQLISKLVLIDGMWPHPQAYWSRPCVWRIWDRRWQELHCRQQAQARTPWKC